MTIQSQNREEAGREYELAWLTMLLFRADSKIYDQAYRVVTTLESEYQFTSTELHSLRESARAMLAET